MVLATTRRCELTRAADTPIGAGFHNVKRLRHGVSANRSGGRPGVWQKDARLKHVILFSPYPDAGEIYCDCRQNRQRHDKTSYFIHLSAVRHTADRVPGPVWRVNPVVPVAWPADQLLPAVVPRNIQLEVTGSPTYICIYFYSKFLREFTEIY